MSWGTLHEMLFALLLCLACLLPEVTMDQNTREIHQSFNTTLLLKGENLNISLVFKVEWCAQLNKGGKNKFSIHTFSPGSSESYTIEHYKKRIIFSQTNFSLAILHVTFSDEGVYTMSIQTTDGKKRTKSTRVTVIMPVTNVKITSDKSPRLGKNITLNCSVTTGSFVSYSWQKCDHPLAKENRSILSTDNTSLTLINIQYSDIGNYRCVAQNMLSSEHDDFALQLCDVSPWLSSGLYGYPGYLGYVIAIVSIIMWVRRYKKGSSKKEPETIYENATFENAPRNRREKVCPIYIRHIKK